MYMGDRKLLKIGTSYGFTIPKAYIDNGQVDPNKKYNITIKEVLENDKDEVKHLC